MIYIGIDIGGTSIKLGLIQDFQLLDTHHVPTIAHQILADTFRAVEELLEKSDRSLDVIAGIGVTIPGPVFDNQLSVLANIQLERMDVYTAFKERYPTLPFKMLNDANAAALGEIASLDPPVKDAVMLTIGTGLGGGIVSNYMLVEGAFGQGGELGHVTLHTPYQFACGCGKTDCAETLLSAKGIRHLANALNPQGATKVTNASNVKQIFNHAKRGDAFALRVVDEWAFYMATLLHQLNVIVNPSVVLFGGGVAAAGPFLIERVQQAYDSLLVWPHDHTVRLALASLGNDAGMMGAVRALVQEEQ
jgi:glucokinase